MAKLYNVLLTLCVFVTTASAVNVTGDTSVCAGDIETYNVPFVSGASYTWTVTGGNPISAPNSDSLAIQWGGAGTGTIVVSQINPAAFYTLNVTMHPKPTPMITHLPYPTCPHDTSDQGGS